MPALAGSRGRKIQRGTEHGYPEVDRVWIEEQPGSRASRMRDEEFVLQYLTLQGLSDADDHKVREVMIVTHRKQLSALLGDGKLLSQI